MPPHSNAFREPFRFAHAAANVTVMFALEGELADAGEAFAQKFADIIRRHVVLFGDDPVAALDIPRDALVRRLRQVLLNLTMRLRETYVERSLREEQCALAVADVSGPLRTSAASILELEGHAGIPPKEALERVVRELGRSDLEALLPHFSEARERRVFPAGQGAGILFGTLELARAPVRACACDRTMNPFDLRGPQFLFFYLLLAAVLLVAISVLRQRLEARLTAGPMPVLHDPYAIAYLRGGKNELLRVAVVSLVDRGLLHASSNNLATTQVGQAMQVRKRIEEDLLRYCVVVRKPEELFRSDAFDAGVQEHEHVLAQHKLVADDGIRRVRRWLANGATAILLVFSLAKISRSH